MNSINHAYRVVWNECKGVWQVAAELVKSHGKGRSAKAVRLAAASGTLLAASMTYAADLPAGGTIVAGSGSISQSGTTMTINQTTQRMAADWQSFSIGQGHTVNFVQPSASSVALNRVVGSDVSVIQGALNANGQVFLINPNGVLFSPTAQVNVGGIVASTLNISNADFMVGNYKFEGASSNAIINQGNISAAPGGTIALIAAKISNDGTLTANSGNVLLGAGSKVVLDMGGPVKLQIENDILETLIQNGGAIKADGGTVLLTSQAAATLASSVINNTGVIEAQTLATGEKGEIILFAHGGAATIGGTLDASAPNGGDGGFIETSGARVSTGENLLVTTRAPAGNTGLWLIDPLTYTVAASGGDETGAALAGRLAGTNIEIQADNTININDAVAWNANKLTLTSGGNININANLTATGTASLAFQYGQNNADGAGSAYTVANSAKIYIPDGGAFTWKKGSGGSTNNLAFNNSFLRFGNGTQDSFTADGQLEQPFYFDNVTTGRNGWYKLTYSNYPLDLAVASGGDGTNSWNYNGEVFATNGATSYSGALSNKSLEISGYQEGKGTIVAAATLSFTSGQNVKIQNAYTLDAGAKFLKTETTLTNLSGTPLTNLRLWVGTRDDYVGPNDSNYKFKGNITQNGFELLTNQDQQSKAIKISESNDGITGAAILFYSISAGADTTTAGCCSFSNVTNKNPRTSLIETGRTDGSYALFMRLSDLAASQSGGMTWYYAAAPVAEIGNVVTSVAVSAGVSAPAPAPAPDSNPAKETAISNAQILPSVLHPPSILPPVLPPSQGTVTQNFTLSGGLSFISLPHTPGQPVTGGTGAGPGQGQGATTGGSGANSNRSGGTGTGDTRIPSDQGGRDPMGFMRVFVVAGGIKAPGQSGSSVAGGIPAGALSGSEQDRQQGAQ